MPWRRLGAVRGVRPSLSRVDGAFVLGDRAGLQRAASNLVANALQYTAPRTEVEVEVSRRADGRIALEVRDRGPGVAPADRARIFERFVRLDAARAGYPEGSGLGLAIVEQIARAHGGAIEVESREGGGAVFRLTLAEAPPLDSAAVTESSASG